MKRFFVIKPRGDELRGVFEIEETKIEETKKENKMFRYVVVETIWGEELGFVLGEIKNCKTKVQGRIIKFLKEQDRILESYLLNAKNKEKKAFTNFRALVKKYKLNKEGMKPIKAYLTFDQKKLIFFYSSPKRIDFRELLKELISVSPYIIRLQQINARQECSMIGGMGICGRELCCHKFLQELPKISKNSLDESSININLVDKTKGACGYLRCCLIYEDKKTSK